MNNASFNFTHMEVDDKPVVYTVLPMIKKWVVNFDYHFKYLIQYAGNLDLVFKNCYAMASTELKATSDGHLYPHLHDLKLEFT